MANYNTHWVVRNVTGSARSPKCACNSWISHWRSATGSRRVSCARLGCSELATDGAHVQIVDGRANRQWFIVPFCANCNRSRHTDLMFVKRDVEMIAANQSLTCGEANWLA